MSGTSPNYDYWRTHPTLKVWFIAAMMQGVDPRALAGVTDGNGDALDLSEDIRLLVSASLVGEITAYPATGQLPNRETEVSTIGLPAWLRGRGYSTVADALTPTVQSPASVNGSSTPHATTPQIAAPTPVPRFAAQEAAIIAALHGLGHDPLQLPRNAPGKAGVKAQVRDQLDSTGIWTGRTVFAKAWERMRSHGAISSK
jgi:hypothetical protein